jgi:hypothetical protein
VKTIKSLSALRSAWRICRRVRWQSWVACYALAALAWPSLGPLPWLAMESLPHQHELVQGAAGFDAHEASPAGRPEHDASSIPGSPTHPINHDCFQCQVLKHLSRCVLAPPVGPEISPPPGCPVQFFARRDSRYASYVALLPPARGPPLASA